MCEIDDAVADYSLRRANLRFRDQWRCARGTYGNETDAGLMVAADLISA